MFKYYRAMSYAEYTQLDKHEELTSSVTWWAFDKDSAARYLSEGKVIAMITLEEPIQAHYKSVASYLGDNAHLELKVPTEDFNRHIARTLIAVERVK